MYLLYDEMLKTVPKRYHWYPVGWDGLSRHLRIRVDFVRTAVTIRIAGLG